MGEAVYRGTAGTAFEVENGQSTRAAVDRRDNAVNDVELAPARVRPIFWHADLAALRVKTPHAGYVGAAVRQRVQTAEAAEQL